MRLEAANHEILRTKIGGVIARGNFGDFFPSVDPQPDAVLPNRGEMRAARDCAHLVTGRRQFNREQTADRARPVDTEFHFLEPGGRKIFFYNYFTVIQLKNRC